MRMMYTYFSAGDEIPIVYMEDHCRLQIRLFVLDDARVYVDDSVYVKLTKDPTIEHNFSCLVTFSTRDPDWRLLLHFEEVHINYNPGTVDRYVISFVCITSLYFMTVVNRSPCI